jgi:hypothetical protein
VIADRLRDEVEWLRDCARWLAQLELGRYPPVVNMRPDTDREGYNLIVDAARIRRILLRIAADVDELARARRVEDLDTAAVDPDRRAERRRRLAEPPLAFPAHGTSGVRRCTTMSANAGSAARSTSTPSSATSTRPNRLRSRADTVATAVAVAVVVVVVVNQAGLGSGSATRIGTPAAA